MVAVMLVLLPLAFTGRGIGRVEGVVLVAYHAAYSTYRLLDAGSSPAVEPLGAAMPFLVVPLTVVWIAFLLVGDVRRRRSA